jgi:hypothetical protein
MDAKRANGSGAGRAQAASKVIDPALIERLRQSGIRIDREGEFQHEGAPVRHEGLRQALFRWLDRLPDGRTVLRLDDHRFAYVDVDDTPLVARAARVDGDAVFVALSDGAEERLDPATLTIDDAGVMRCSARGGRLDARIATSAATVLAERIDDRPTGPVLRTGGREFSIRRR